MSHEHSVQRVEQAAKLGDLADRIRDRAHQLTDPTRRGETLAVADVIAGIYDTQRKAALVEINEIKLDEL